VQGVRILDERLIGDCQVHFGVRRPGPRGIHRRGGLLDQLRAEIKRQGKEPDCGIKKTGFLPMPCFTDYQGTDVKPAAGSIYEPSVVTVRVTRVKPDPDFAMSGCSLSVSMYLKNYFQGAKLGGVTAKPGPIEGDAFVPATSPIPGLALGKSADVKLVFAQIKERLPPGIYDPVWGYAGWVYLYNGGTGSLSAGSRSDQAIKFPNGQFERIGCSQGDTLPVQIPMISSLALFPGSREVDESWPLQTLFLR